MRKVFVYLSLLLIYTSCEIINPEEEVPGYITIDRINLAAESNPLGITDAWVYIDGNLQGVYEIPAEFPVLEKGLHEISILAGIKVNGISATRSWYPFYEPYTIEADISEAKIELDPVIDYEDDIYFMWEENFENIGISLDTAPSSDTSIVYYDVDPFAGNYSGGIFLQPGHIYFESITTNNYPDLPRDSKPVFLEMNYKNDIEFFVGMYILEDGSLKSQSLIQINKSEEWNKIYIDLANALTDYQNASSFLYYILAYKDQNDTEKSTILLDNLRIVLSEEYE